MNSDEDIFKQFTQDLSSHVLPKGMSQKDLLALQAKQFLTLSQGEDDFRRKLAKHQLGLEIYARFCKHFGDRPDGDLQARRRGLLASRPYFRERQGVCAGPIGNAIREASNPDSAKSKAALRRLMEFRINYNFVSFALDFLPAQDQLRSLARQIFQIRQTIVSQNTPLAISQARVFYRKAPVKMRDHRFTAMDFVQIAVEGLMSAVDKFVVPPKVAKSPKEIQVWRAVAIGRMRGNFIEMFSSTSFHYNPGHKRILYRANKHLHRLGPGERDFNRLARFVNQDLEEDGLSVTGEELSVLMGASAWVGDPSDHLSAGNERPQVPKTVTESASAPDSWQPDVRYEEHEIRSQIQKIISELPLLDQKLLLLRGIDPEQLC
jgi:hypothetical protein